jgi:predicted RNA-binding protein YlqC (UPF0109 family)
MEMLEAMSTSIDQQFVEYIVKSLVSNPDAVQVVRTIDEKGVLLELTVDPEDLGRVIGKRGATAQSVRTLLRALGTKNDARYNLKIVDNGQSNGYGGGSSHDDHSSTLSSSSSDSSANSSSSDDDNDDDSNSVVSKTRKELEDLDDLDV